MSGWLAGWVVLIRCDAQKEGGVGTETRLIGSVCDRELGIRFATRWQLFAKGSNSHLWSFATGIMISVVGT